MVRLASAFLFALLCAPAFASTLIKGGIVVDGTGKGRFRADVRISGDKITEVGQLSAKAGEEVIDATDKIVAPGFIDAHSHADGALDKLESQIREGITTAVCGQDGGRSISVREAIDRVKNAPIRFAFFSGEGGLRTAVMKTTDRKATPTEIKAMCSLLEQDMKDGALGLSTGLEYDPGHYSSTEELIELSKVAAKYHGIYISHMRDESEKVFESIEELIRIGREAKLPAQISHIKMAVASKWGQASRALQMMDDAKPLDISADLYPYTYWQSTIRVLITSRDYHNRQVWVDALKEVGGPANVRLSSYSVEPEWVGKTLAEISTLTGRGAPELIMEIIDKTADDKGRESVIVTAMTEADLKTFMRDRRVMFCSDGSGGGSHPRGAGTFPRILGRYVREQRVLSLEEAVRKMTSLPAARFGLLDRGIVRPGMSADLVVFDPKTIIDRATPADPTAFAEGVTNVFVQGKKRL
jgi:N-acyl-D-amino-acid deacylase